MPRRACARHEGLNLSQGREAAGDGTAEADNARARDATRTRELEAFYASRAGTPARRLIYSALRCLWPAPSGGLLLGLGCTRPWLPQLARGEAGCLAVSSAPRGGEGAASEGQVAEVAADVHMLPFASASLRRVVVLHLLEHSPEPRVVLEEIWRALEVQGEVLCGVPGRGGFWARNESSPFGSGQPFSRRQLAACVESAGFAVEGQAAALFLPPGVPPVFGSSLAWERIGRRRLPRLGGVQLVLARKLARDDKPTPVRVARARTALRPALGAGVQNFQAK